MKRTLQIILLATMAFWFVPIGAGQQPPQKKVDVSGKNKARPPVSNSTPPPFSPSPSPSPTPSADISVSETLVRKRRFLAGEAVQYRIIVRNAGPSTAKNVRVTSTTTNLTNLTFESSGECIDSICTIKSIDPRSSATINITANIVARGKFNSTVSIAAAESDPKPGNNTSSVSGEAGPATQPNANSDNNNSQNGPNLKADPTPRQPFLPPWFWLMLILAEGAGILVVGGGGGYLIWRLTRPPLTRPEPVSTEPRIQPAESEPLPDTSPQPPTLILNPDVELKYGKSEIDGLQMTGPQIRLLTGLEMGDTSFNGPVPIVKTEVFNE